MRNCSVGGEYDAREMIGWRIGEAVQWRAGKMGSR